METYVGLCPKMATWFLVEGNTPDAYTLACDEHHEAMKSDTYIESLPSDNYGHCCYIIHASDCAVYNGPAMEPGPCSCGALTACGARA